MIAGIIAAAGFVAAILLQIILDHRARLVGMSVGPRLPPLPHSAENAAFNAGLDRAAHIASQMEVLGGDERRLRDNIVRAIQGGRRE